MENQEKEIKKKRDFLLPGSIVIAAVLIAGSLIYSAGKTPEKNNTTTSGAQETGNALINISKVTDDDHILGNKNAPIKIVLFSDTECQFCKNFHTTMQEVMKNYGNNVAWVYRHAPIDEWHPKARTEAEATECAAELGGNEKFWAYLDRLMEITPSNNGLDPAKLPEIAKYIGLDEGKFNACLSSGKYKNKVQAQLDESIASGMEGTPYSVVLINDKPKYAIPGAVPFEEEKKGEPYMKLIMEQLLKEI